MTPEETKNLIENSDSFDTTLIGTRTSHLGIEENVGIPDEKRILHTLITGPTGYGKTQVILHAALQDAEKDHGYLFINPKGEAISQLLAKLPEDRVDDVIYINPGGETDPPPINVLEPHITEEMTQDQVENQKDIIVSELMELFRRQSENWGDRWPRVLESLLRAHINLNIEENENNSLLDVFQCVVQDDVLADLIDRTRDTVVREQLVRIREDMSSYDLDPLQRRLNDFVMNATIRKVIAAEDSCINFRDAVKQDKIILVDVPKGKVGSTVAELVGSIVITKLWAAVQSRITEDLTNRSPYYLYVDELQNFASEGSALATMLAEAREYRLGCWFATQYLENLESQAMRRAVTNNCRSKIIFNPDGSDNESRITGMLPGIDKDQLQALGKYRAVLQTPDERKQTAAVTFDTYPPWTADSADLREVKRHTAPSSSSEATVRIEQSIGNSANAGGDVHHELLAEAKKHLDSREGVQVNLLYQDAGDEKPDGRVSLPDGSTANLEAEHSTLTKPAKVLKNLVRAVESGHECLYVVEEGKAVKLQNIVGDPVNRRGDDNEDEHGSYSHYQREDGQPFTETDELVDAEYRIIEVGEEDLDIHNEAVDVKCPLVDDNPREDLETFCLHRDSDTGHCNELGQTCVLID